MSHVDATWLGTDSPTNLMIINGVLLFDEVIDFERLQAVFRRGMVDAYRRFRQRVVAAAPGARQLYWEDDPHFDLRSHLLRIALPAPGDTATLQALISSLMSEPLSRDKPLWRFYLIENYQGGCAVFGRIHHAVGDGIALIRVLLSLATDEADPAPEPEPERTAPSRERASPVVTALQRVQSARALAAGVGRMTVREGMQTLSNPGHTLELARSSALLASASALILAKLLLIPEDRPSEFKGDLHVIKRVLWSEPLDLREVKRIGRTMGATVNDVLVAMAAGAVRRYILAHQGTPAAGDLRAMVPINLRPLDAEPSLGNQFSLVYLELPVSLELPLARLFAVKRQMDILKHSPEPLLIYQILNLLGTLPLGVAHQATDWFASKASFVLTNVPGPQHTLYFGGKALRRMMFWVPQSGNISTGISLISYDGTVTLGISVDETLIPNPELIIAGFQSEYAEFQQLASMASAQESI
jgi:WS/DGAT/MGAT family acyltransferase